MTRYELAHLTIHVGSAPKAAAAIAAYTSDPAARGRLLGCWLSELGALNQIAVLRGFADDAELAAERRRALASTDPFGCAEFATALSMDSYAPFPGMPEIETGAFGPIYEIRTYVMKLGGLPPTLDAWAEALPARRELSPLVIAMHTLDGPPRMTHIWPYPSLDARAAIRAESVKRGVWPPKNGPAWLSSMQTSIYLPLEGSPLK